MHHSKKVVVRGCPNNLEKYGLRDLTKKEKRNYSGKKSVAKNLFGTGQENTKEWEKKIIKG